jgi:hypothetical protein
MTTSNPLHPLAPRPQDALAGRAQGAGGGALQPAAGRPAADLAPARPPESAWTGARPGTLPEHGHTVSDFSAAPLPAGGDAIDLRELLRDQPKGFGRDAGALAKHLAIDTASSPGSTILRLSRGGAFAGLSHAEAEDGRVTLAGVDLRAAVGLGPAAPDAQVIAELLARGKLLADFG